MNPVDAFLIVCGAAFALMIFGAALTFGIISTCRFMNWVPVVAVTYVTVQSSPQVTEGAPND
jgi:hypothetical protein